MAVFFQADAGFRASHLTEEGDDGTFLSFGKGFIEETLESRRQGFDAKTLTESSHTLLDPRSVLATRLVVSAGSRTNTHAIAVEELAIDLLDTLRRAAGTEPRPTEHYRNSKLAAAAMDLLSSDPCQRIGLTAFSRKLGSSPYHLSRTFRAVYGMPIYRYQTRLRLLLALERVLSTEDDLTVIAFDCGFSSHSHLTSVFGKTFGASPSDVRRLKGANSGAKRQFEPRPT